MTLKPMAVLIAIHDDMALVMLQMFVPLMNGLMLRSNKFRFWKYLKILTLVVACSSALGIKTCRPQLREWRIQWRYFSLSRIDEIMLPHRPMRCDRTDRFFVYDALRKYDLRKHCFQDTLCRTWSKQPFHFVSSCLHRWVARAGATFPFEFETASCLNVWLKSIIQ